MSANDTTLNEARERIAASGSPSLAELRERFGGFPDVSGEVKQKPAEAGSCRAPSNGALVGQASPDSKGKVERWPRLPKRDCPTFHERKQARIEGRPPGVAPGVVIGKKEFGR